MDLEAYKQARGVHDKKVRFQKIPPMADRQAHLP